MCSSALCDMCACTSFCPRAVKPLYTTKWWSWISLTNSELWRDQRQPAAFSPCKMLLQPTSDNQSMRSISNSLCILLSPSFPWTPPVWSSPPQKCQLYGQKPVHCSATSSEYGWVHQAFITLSEPQKIDLVQPDTRILLETINTL